MKVNLGRIYFSFNFYSNGYKLMIDRPHKQSTTLYIWKNMLAATFNIIALTYLEKYF